MTEKRYFKRELEEEYYIFDSETISEKEFDEKLEYEDYQAFVDSMQGDEVVDRLNALHEENQSLKFQLDECRNNKLFSRRQLEKENEQLKKELEDALLDVKIYKNANATFDNVYQENNKLKSRIEYLEMKIQRERNSTQKQYEKWEKEAETKIKELSEENEQLKKELHLMHMRGMFSTVKSFKGDISKRYTYSEETDNVYDSANHYGQYCKILGKKEMVMLLNEYETVLKELKE